MGGNIALSKGVGERWIASIVGITNLVAFSYDSANWRSPSMVAPRVEETLIDCSSIELILVPVLLMSGKLINTEHLSDRVALVLQPEFIIPSNVVLGHLEVRVVLGVVEDLMRSSRVKGTSRFNDFSIEPLMPTLEAEGSMFRVVNKVIVVDSSSCRRTEPSIRLRVHVLQ